MSKRPSMFSGRQALGVEPPAEQVAKPAPPARSVRVVQTTVSPDTLKKLNAIVVDEQTSLRELLREGIGLVLKARGETMSE